MDWDILFLMPITWASPVLAPVIVSLTMLIFAVVILYRNCCNQKIKVKLIDALIFSLAIFILVISFCIGGLHMSEADYKSYFHWPLFAAGEVLAIILFLRCLLKSK